MKKSLAALMACVVLFTPMIALSQAAVVKINGQSDLGGNYWYGVGYWNGTTWIPGKSDPNGILRTTEEYPPQLQVETQANAAIAVTTGLKQIGDGWSCAPFKERVLRIRRASTGGTGASFIHLYLFGSHDDVNYYPVSPVTAWKIDLAPGDTTAVDTLGLSIPAGRNTSGVYEFKVTLPSQDFYPGAYMAIWARRDSSASSAATLTLTYEGRWR